MDNIALITIVGIITIFIVLFILMIIVKMFKYIALSEMKSNRKNKQDIIPIPKTQPTLITENDNNKVEKISTEENTDNKEEIAAIMGAISSYMKGKSYSIKKIKKYSTEKSTKINIPSRWGTVSPVTIWRTK